MAAWGSCWRMARMAVGAVNMEAAPYSDRTRKNAPASGVPTGLPCGHNEQEPVTWMLTFALTLLKSATVSAKLILPVPPVIILKQQTSSPAVTHAPASRSKVKGAQFYQAAAQL